MDGGMPMSDEAVGDPAKKGPSPAPACAALTWRGWVVAIIVAVILSVSATLLLGGSYRLTGAAATGACGGVCCLPPEK